jgi:hypothetical protein
MRFWVHFDLVNPLRGLCLTATNPDIGTGCRSGSSLLVHSSVSTWCFLSLLVEFRVIETIVYSPGMTAALVHSVYAQHT